MLDNKKAEGGPNWTGLGSHSDEKLHDGSCKNAALLNSPKQTRHLNKIK